MLDASLKRDDVIASFMTCPLFEERRHHATKPSRLGKVPRVLRPSYHLAFLTRVGFYKKSCMYRVSEAGVVVYMTGTTRCMFINKKKPGARTMSQKTGLNSWENTVIEHMPHLSKPQAMVLALWSFGIVMAQTCGLTA